MAGSAPQTVFEHTGPERLAQDLLRRAGVPFRTHAKELPGNPDIVVDATKVAIFVHGCFWHNHGCEHATPPSPESDHAESIRQKQLRDAANPGRLSAIGWKTCVVWECELKRSPILARDRMLAAIGCFDRTDGITYGVPGNLRTTYKTPFTLWATFGLLGSVVLVAAGYSTVGIREQAALDAEVSAAAERLRELQSSIDSATSQEAAARERLNAAKQELEPANAQFESLKAQAEVLQRRTGSLNVELGSAEAEISRLREQIASSKSELMDAQAAASRAQRDADAAKAQADIERSTLQTLSGQRADVEAALRDATSQLSRYRSEATATFAELKAARDQLAGAQEEASSVSEGVKEANAVIAEARSARTTLTELRSDLEQGGAQREQLDRSLKALRETLAAETTALSELRATAAGLRQSISEARADIVDLEAEQRRIASVLIADREAVRRSTEERTITEQKASEAELGLREATAVLEEARRNRESIRLDIEALSASKLRQQQAFDALQAELASLSDSAAEARANSIRRAANQAIGQQLEELAAVFGQLLSGLREAALLTPPPKDTDPTEPNSATPGAFD